MQLLKNYFINTWILTIDLEIIVKSFPKTEIADFAQNCLEKYNFPVESLLILPNGTVLHHINANVLLDIENDYSVSFFDGFIDPMEKKYTLFLKEGISKAQKFLNNKDEI